MPHPAKCCFEIPEDMIHILLTLKVLLKQGCEVEDLFCGA